MPTFTIEQDRLGEFFDPINYDIENGGERPAYHFCAGLAKQVGGSALELACGAGLVTSRLAGQGLPITGLDIEPGMLAQARHKSERQGLPVRWMQTDARTGMDVRFRRGRKVDEVSPCYNQTYGSR